MNRSKRTHGLAVVLTTVLTGGLVLLSIVPEVIAGHVHRTYRVEVVSSFGTTFTDCFRFDTPRSGDLSLDLLPYILIYRHGRLAKVRSRFNAVTRDHVFEIMFFGQFINPLKHMTGEGVSEEGATFVFSGQRDDACVASELSGQSATHPYSR
jgi:hypothetical protein